MHQPPLSQPRPPGTRLLVIGWAGADWSIIRPLLDAGRLPNFQRLLSEGVAAKLGARGPIQSPLLWTSAATGKGPAAHRILGFTEPDPAQTGTGVRLIASTSRRGKAFWNILSQTGRRTHVVGWVASHPVEPINGVCVSDRYGEPVAEFGKPWPLPAGTVHPAALADTLAELRVHPGEITLENLRSFIPGIGSFDPATEPALGFIATRLAEVASRHVAATYVLENHAWDCLAVLYPTLDHLSRHFIEYHPPHLPHVPAEKFARLQNVVNAAYELQDAMLGTLLQLAGDETAVLLVSDHGFYRDHLRPAGGLSCSPGEAGEHRPVGVLALRAPGVRRDEWIFGVNLIDVTPTILTLFGLPVGADMGGCPLIRAFVQPPPIRFIPSWDEINGPHSAGLHATDPQVNSGDSHSALRQFAEHGGPAESAAAAAADSARELAYNLGLVLLFEGRAAEALPHLEEMCAARPESITANLHRISCLQLLARFDDASARLEELAEDRHPARLPLKSGRAHDSPPFDLMRGILALQRGEPEAALQHLIKARAAQPQLGDLHLHLGRVWMGLGRWSDAEAAFATALASDPDLAAAHTGRASALHRLRRWSETAEEALCATERDPADAFAHYLLGLAMGHLGRRDAAISSLENSLRRPWAGTASAHRVMAWLCRGNPASADAARQHRLAAGRLTGRGAKEPGAPT